MEFLREFKVIGLMLVVFLGFNSPKAADLNLIKIIGSDGSSFNRQAQTSISANSYSDFDVTDSGIIAGINSADGQVHLYYPLEPLNIGEPWTYSDRPTKLSETFQALPTGIAIVQLSNNRLGLFLSDASTKYFSGKIVTDGKLNRGVEITHLASPIIDAEISADGQRVYALSGTTGELGSWKTEVQYEADVFNSFIKREGIKGETGFSLTRENDLIVLNKSNPNHSSQGKSQLTMFKEDGVAVNTKARFGQEFGEILNPGDVAIDRFNRFWVINSGNHRISVFDKDWNPMEEFLGFGLDSEKTVFPSKLKIIQGEKQDLFYLLDKSTGQIKIFGLEYAKFDTGPMSVKFQPVFNKKIPPGTDFEVQAIFSEGFSNVSAMKLVFVSPGGTVSQYAMRRGESDFFSGFLPQSNLIGKESFEFKLSAVLRNGKTQTSEMFKVDIKTSLLGFYFEKPVVHLKDSVRGVLTFDTPITSQMFKIDILDAESRVVQKTVRADDFSPMSDSILSQNFSIQASDFSPSRAYIARLYFPQNAQTPLKLVPFKVLE